MSVHTNMKQGKVVITGKKEEGFFKKYMVYKGYLYGAPGVSGKSVNRSLRRTYHHGDEVTVNYAMLAEVDGNERMSFEIVE